MTGSVPPTPGEPGYGEFPLKQYLGMTLGEVDDRPGVATAEVTLGDEHRNPNGVAHGAVLFALVDTAMGKATASTIDDGRHCASIEVSLRFIRPALDGRVVASARVLKRGRHVAHLAADVVDDAGVTIATADGTFAVIGD